MKVKVRVALAVDPNGYWNATGWGGGRLGTPPEAEVMGLAVEAVEDGEARYWLEAEVEVPEVPVVAAAALPCPQEKWAA